MLSLFNIQYYHAKFYMNIKYCVENVIAFKIIIIENNEYPLRYEQKKQELRHEKESYAICVRMSFI